MNKAEKTAEVEQMTNLFLASQATVCVDYRGLPVSKISNLRKKLRGAGCVAKVAKNTLTKLSAKGSLNEKNNGELERFLGVLKGPSMMVFSPQDPIAPTKILVEFAKENEQLAVKGCWLDGAFVDPDGVKSLSNMPGRDETFAMLLSLLNAPASKLVRLLNEPASQVARVIEAQRKKLAGE